MATWAWVIDQTTCIGCHACTTACKSENAVPVGVNRTWVKYVETGTFPETRREIAVLRCNHCEKPPCVAICPTRAMFRRPDGIVGFDSDRCIGCKACLQACPYDAIFIDPVEHTAEKCDFCAHRVDAGRLPACVVVCPTQSLVFGDLDDPDSRAARVIASRPTSVRRPEQGTRPKAFYVGAGEAVLDPLAARHESRYVWADRPTGGGSDHTSAVATLAWPAATGTVGRELPVIAVPTTAAVPATGATRGPGITPVAAVVGGEVVPPGLAPAPQAVSVAGPGIVAAESGATGVGRVAYDVFHPRPWGWRVALYLWTKGLGAGAFGVLFLILALGLASADLLVRLAVGFVALAGTGVTALLLVADLKRPERFWTILVRAQRRSWLAIGAFILIGYSGALGLWWLGTLVGVGESLLVPLGWVALGLGFWAAFYSYFLLAQCEARDLWQNPMVALTLVAQAGILGSAAVLGVTAVVGTGGSLGEAAAAALALAASANLVALVFGEALGGHPTANARAAAHLLVRGPWRAAFWVGGVGLAGLSPLAALVAPALGLGTGLGTWPMAIAGLAAAAGLLWYERAFIAAGQAVPIS